MQIRDVMVRDVKTCSGTDSLNRAAQIMWEHDCGVVPVVDDDGRVIGIVTDRDACMAAYTKGRAFAQIGVEEVMSRDVISCRPTDGVAEVEKMMQKRRVRRLPVTDPQGFLKGIVSLNDLARRAAARVKSTDPIALAEVAETLAAVCRPWCDVPVRAVVPARPAALCTLPAQTVTGLATSGRR